MVDGERPEAIFTDEMVRRATEGSLVSGRRRSEVSERLGRLFDHILREVEPEPPETRGILPALFTSTSEPADPQPLTYEALLEAYRQIMADSWDRQFYNGSPLPPGWPPRPPSPDEGEGRTLDDLFDDIDALLEDIKGSGSGGDQP